MRSDRIDKILRPVERYLHNESTAGIVLLICALIAVIWANSPWSDSYIHLWEIEVSLRVGGRELGNTLHHWINDGLMAMFFFVVGLELKREIIAGELSDIKKAMLPLSSALGGMIAPALIYILFNPSGLENNGWGIPMATDIAFAMGIISLLGKGVPLALKIFLTALAIADDLGAVLVIAFFYTSDISLLSLGAGALFLTILLVANYIGIRSTLFYGLIGIGGVWLAFLLSGVHATIAGVVAAAAIPARTKINEQKFIDVLDQKLKEFHDIPPNDVTLLEPAQYKVIEGIHRLTKAAGTPLQRLESQLHPWVSFVIMPLFALANAGVVLHGDRLANMFSNTVTLGVFAGLTIGKFFGVVGFCWLAIKLGISKLPDGVNWRQIFGVGCLAGVGFTMSLFVTTLAFSEAALVDTAKLGIFAASLVSGIAGYIVLKSSSYSKTLGTRK
jgi:Na+:H+ antiporter, NhaA family